MVSNIACSAPGCTNPVIGQCGGYKRNCGSFYCSVHSKDKYCSECSKHKLRDDLINEYNQLAQDIDKQAMNERYKWSRPLFILIVAMVCLPFLLTNYLEQVNPSLAVWMFILVPIGIAIFTIGIVYIYFFDSQTRKKLVSKTVSTRPHFDEFYKVYRSEKRKEKLLLAGSFAMGLIAVAADDIQKSYEKQRQEEMVRKAVDAELNRHGL